MPLNLKRILKFSWNDFKRNSGNNFAAVFVLSLPILLVSGLFIFSGFSDFIVGQLKTKIDVTAFFKPTVTEEQILEVKKEILKLSPEIESVEFVSQEEALDEFQKKHKDNPDIMRALDEVGDNPFPASLNITTSQPEQYRKVSEFLEEGQYAGLIDSVDYSQKKDTIEKAFAITSNVNKFGIILGAALFLIAITVVLNTIKLSVDSSKEEITTMKLVGASNWFIRGPFVIQGAICGLAAFLICLILIISAVYFLSPRIDILLPGFSIMDYFVNNLWILLSIQIGCGIGLGAVASYILVRSYLKV